MAYLSLYRKYRPQTFEDVVGQGHVTTTLQNALRKGNIPSGYLFSGTRGTAKTTCARILAKALNCIGRDGTLTAPTPTPCCECGPCRAVASSGFVDVIEMDAASHGKVDDVRDIVASIMYPPMEGRYKVYIIDEAHQLSRDAMDAFLKTLEEPPDRVVFILATTEVEKLPITIASRCQVFEFRRGSIPDISARLVHVMDEEGATYAEAVVPAIARAADGSYRDSLSILEQVLAYKSVDITLPDLSVVLGTVDSESLSRVVHIISSGDTSQAFAFAAELFAHGKEVRQFFRSLNLRLRDLMYVAAGAPAAELSAPHSVLKQEAHTFPVPVLLQMIETLSDAEASARLTTQHQLLLEVTLIKLISLAQRQTSVAPEQQRAAPRAEAIAGPTHPTGATRDAEIDVPSLADTLPEDEPATDTIDVPFMQLQTVAADAPHPEKAPQSDPLPEDASAVIVQLKKSWQAVINRMATRSPSGVALIKDAAPIDIHGSTIILKMSHPFSVDRLQNNPKGKKVIEDIINKTLNVEPETYSIKCVLTAPAAARRSDPVAAAPAPPPLNEPVAARDEPALAEDDRLLDQVIAVFGGKIVED